MELELKLLWGAVVAYVVAGVTAIFALVLKRKPERTILTFLILALLAHAASLALRWVRLGHGPFITLFEILSSHLWSVLVVYALAYWRLHVVRPTAALLMPVVFVLLGWLVLAAPDAGNFPPTYRTPWLYVHIGMAKIFAGCVLVALGLAGIILLRAWPPAAERLAALPDDRRLEDLTYRFMALALVFDSLMLISGAIWAQDAWGRYWAWDPLETSSFVTWILIALAMHARVAFKLYPRLSATLVLGVFVMAFLTFFGIPFVSTPHKGAV